MTKRISIISLVLLAAFGSPIFADEGTLGDSGNRKPTGLLPSVDHEHTATEQVAPKQSKWRPTFLRAPIPIPDSFEQFFPSDLSGGEENEDQLPKIKGYFPDGIDEDEELNSDSLENMIADARAIYDGLKRPDDPPDFLEGNLIPFLRSLTAKDLLNSKGEHQKIGAIQDWPLYGLIKFRQIACRVPLNVKWWKTSLVRRVAVGSGVAAVSGALYHFVDPHALWTNIGMAFAAGVTGPLLQAATEPFMTPVAESIKTGSSLVSQPLTQFIQNTVDEINPIMARVQTATLEKFGGDHGMLPEEQKENWKTAKRNEVAVQTSYSSVLRDVYHHGRFLIIGGWADATMSTTLIQLTKVDLRILEGRIDDILQPYRNFLMFTDRQKFDRFTETVFNFNAACADLWTAMLLDNRDQWELREEVGQTWAELKSFDINPIDLQKIVAIQVERAKTTRVKVTAISIQELRDFMFPERLRNMDGQAGLAAKQLRSDFGTMADVEEHKPAVQSFIRKAGYKASAPVVMKPDCQSTLEGKFKVYVGQGQTASFEPVYRQAAE